MKEIFVFGSNLGGHHGAGSARAAVEDYGAKMGLGVGPAGNSYAIPTKDSNIEVMDIEDIAKYVTQFIEYAKYVLYCEKFTNDTYGYKTQFNIVAIGCGLAGFTPEQIAPLFEGAPKNCVFINNWNIINTKEMEDGQTYS